VSSNPFSTRFIRPGAIPFVFPEDQSADGVAQRLRERNWWGQIIGDHGSGKSTLLATLVPALEAAGRTVVSVGLHQNERRLPALDQSTFSSATQLVIDGYEQLSWWSRWRVNALCRRRGAGLLVTAHTDVGLPMIYETQPSEELARSVVARLIAEPNGRITSDDVSNAYAATNGNVREALFRLYDVYQRRQG
jgi:hypothetical protein